MNIFLSVQLMVGNYHQLLHQMLLVLILKNQFYGKKTEPKQLKFGFNSGSRTSSCCVWSSSGNNTHKLMIPRGDTVPEEGRRVAAELCPSRASGLLSVQTVVSLSWTMRHLIRLNSAALLDSLQTSEIRSSPV